MILKRLPCSVERHTSQLRHLPSDLELLLRLSLQHYPPCYPSIFFQQEQGIPPYQRRVHCSPSVIYLLPGTVVPPSAPSLAHSPLWFPALELCTGKVFSCGTVTSLAWRSPLSDFCLWSMLKKIISPTLFAFSPH